MNPHSRREFLADVGKGMLVASVGPALAGDLGLAPALAGEAPGALTFGKMEPPIPEWTSREAVVTESST